MRRRAAATILLIGALLYYILVPANATPNDKLEGVWTNEKQAFLQKVTDLVARRRGKEALQLSTAQLKQHPSDACFYAIRARVYSGMDENEACLKDADKAISLSPNLCNAISVKSIALLRLNRTQEAIAINDKAFALEPKNQQILDDRIEILYWMGRRKEAIKLLEQQARDRPNDGVKRGQLIKLYISDKQHNKVIEHSTIQLKTFPNSKNNDYFLNVRGDAYFELGEYSKAEQDYLGALKKNAVSMPAMRGLAKVYAKTGRAQEAKDMQERLRNVESEYQPL